MITQDVVIPRSVIRAMEAELRAPSFTYGSVTKVCIDALVKEGVERGLAYDISGRTADKFLQFERKANRISYSNGKWSLVK